MKPINDRNRPVLSSFGPHLGSVIRFVAAGAPVGPQMLASLREAVRATAAPVAVPRDKDAAVTCRDAGVELVMAADQKWEVDVPTKFQWMPGGVSLVTPSYGGRTIRMAVLCDESTARAVQASFDRWRKTMPKQRPFGCVEHREQEAAFLPTHFEWDTERNGVACCGTPTALGAQNVNGRIHRSWSPTFTTDADYESCKCSDCGLGWDGCDAARCEGVMEFPDGVRGSLQNPAQVTGVAFSVGSLTNKPAFRNIDPVRARDGSVKAAWSDAAREAAMMARRAAAKFSQTAYNQSSMVKDNAAPKEHAKAAEAHREASDAHTAAMEAMKGGDDSFAVSYHAGMAKVHADQARGHMKGQHFPVSASDPGVRASGTSEGAKKGWLHRFHAGVAKHGLVKFGKHHKETAEDMAEANFENPGRFSHENAMEEVVERHWDEIAQHASKVLGIKDPTKSPEDESVHFKASVRLAGELAKQIRDHANNSLTEIRKAMKASDPGVRASGTSEGARKGWDTKKRGGVDFEKMTSIHDFASDEENHPLDREMAKRAYQVGSARDAYREARQSPGYAHYEDPHTGSHLVMPRELRDRVVSHDLAHGMVKANESRLVSGAVRAAFGAFAPGHPFHGNQYSGEAETLEDAMYASNLASKASGKAHMSGGKAEHHATAAEEHDHAAEAHDRAAGLSNTGSREAKLHMMQKTMHENMAMAHRHAAELSRVHSDLVKATDPTVKAHCKDNLYADVPDATEAEAAEYDRLVDGGSSHQVAVAELRKKRNPADATVQTSDAILARLAGEPVRATGTSEGAKKGWESRSKWHTHAGNLSEAASALEVKHHGRSDVDAHVDLRHAHGVAADAWETVAHEAAEHNDKEGQLAYMARSKAHRDQQKRHSEMENAGRRARRDMPGPWNATDATLTSEQILSRLGGGKTGRTAA
jgi:hypothetical protein